MELSSGFDERHTLIIGGTGMLRQASTALARRSKVMPSVARTAASLQKLERELQHCCERHFALQLDWRDTAAFLDALEVHCTAVGFPTLVLAWLHDDELGPQVARRIGASRENCRFFQVRSSAAADPALGSAQLAKAWMDAPVQQREIILGFQVTRSGSRWLHDSEIASGVLAAIDANRQTSVVGVVSPWTDRLLG